MAGVWNNIEGVKEEFQKRGINVEEIMVKEIKSGDDTMFWLNKWHGSTTFNEAFPDLFQLEQYKFCKVKDRIDDGGVKWNWKTVPAAASQVSNLNQILSLLHSFQPVTGADAWKCTNSMDEEYHVHTIRHMLDDPLEETLQGEVIKWTRDVPIKVLCFVWRANQDRIPTVIQLQKRGVPIQESSCGYCTEEGEDAAHVLWHCPYAATVWYWVFKWCEIPIPTIQNVGDLILFVNQWGQNEKTIRDLTSITYGTLWLIWKARCDRLFKKKRTSPTVLADNVKSIVFTWLKHRRSKCTYNWIEWCLNPFMCR